MNTKIEEIKEAYDIVNEYLGNGVSENTSETREEVKFMLESILEDKVDNIKCDLENNPPDVVDDGALIACVGYGDKYIDLTFGKEVIWEHEILEE